METDKTKITELLSGVGLHPLDATKILDIVINKYGDIPGENSQVFAGDTKITDSDIREAVIAWFSDIRIPEAFRSIMDSFLSSEDKQSLLENTNKITLFGIYFYDPLSYLFINNSGEKISFDQIIDIIDNDIMQTETMLSNLTALFLKGLITSTVWYETVAYLLRIKNIQYAALGAGGWRQLTEKDKNNININLANDLNLLVDFVSDIVLGVYMLKGGGYKVAAILNRLGMYLGSARRMFWSAIKLLKLTKDTVTIERRVLRPAEHCQDCVDYFYMGWQLKGVLPDPGMGSVCLSNCRCVKYYKTIKRSDLANWLNTIR